MKRIAVGVVYTLLFVYLAGCATTPKSPSVDFKERIFSGSYNDIFQAVIVSYNDSGYSYVTQDKDKGIIETEWRPEKNILAGLFIGKLRSKIITKLYRMDDLQTRVSVEIVVEKQTAPDQWQSTSLVKEGNYKELFNGIQENLTDIQKS